MERIITLMIEGSSLNQKIITNSIYFERVVHSQGYTRILNINLILLRVL